MMSTLIRGLRTVACRAAALPGDLHRDQRGVMSLVSVFAVMFLIMLLGMVMNTGRQIDGKIRMQNAADDAAYTGGLCIARGMNDIAFMNNLLCEMFSMTAILREASEENAVSFVPQIIAAWQKAAGTLASSSYGKFKWCGTDLQQKLPVEQQLVTTFSQVMQPTAQAVLPAIEEVLSGQLIPQYEQAVVQSFPDVAQAAAAEVAKDNGNPDYNRGTLYGVLWRASTGQAAVGGDDSLPVVDAQQSGGGYQEMAQQIRNSLAMNYLTQWNNNFFMRLFDHPSGIGGYDPADSPATTCQFGALWRAFTCGQLQKLLAEYPETNLPYMIKSHKPTQTDLAAPGETPMGDPGTYMDNQFTYFGVSYWKQVPDSLPQWVGHTLFKNPAQTDALAYAQVQIFVPQPRLQWEFETIGKGGPGQVICEGGTSTWRVKRDWKWVHPLNPTTNYVGTDATRSAWDSFTQDWTCKLVPAVHQNLGQVLQTQPSTPTVSGINVPTGLSSLDLQQINTH